MGGTGWPLGSFFLGQLTAVTWGLLLPAPYPPPLKVYLCSFYSTYVKKDILFYFLFIFLLEYSCFTLLCQLLLYSKVYQPYVYIYPLFSGFPSHLGHHRALSRVPCALQ